MIHMKGAQCLLTAQAYWHVRTRLRDWLFSLLLLLTFVPVALCGDTALPAILTARAQRIYQEFVPPCCWRGSLATHQSPAANHLREEIDVALESGESDSQIKTQVIHEYGNAILRVPEGTLGEILFAVPTSLFGLSMLILSAALAHWASRRKAAPIDSVAGDSHQYWSEIVEADPEWKEA